MKKGVLVHQSPHSNAAVQFNILEVIVVPPCIWISLLLLARKCFGGEGKERGGQRRIWEGFVTFPSPREIWDHPDFQ